MARTNRYRRIFDRMLTFSRGALDLKSLGTGDGASTVPVNLIVPESVCYCAGVGLDISFDIELAKLGANVFCFDPTPRSIEFMRVLDSDRKRISFLADWGLRRHQEAEAF